VRVIYGGADPRRFSPEPREPRAGVLFVGRITPHKGIERLLEALPPRASLTIVGTDGHDRGPPEAGYPELLRRMAAGRDVSFRWGVDDTELARLYRRATVLAMPSVHITCYGRPVPVSELLGLAALEAMASGTPVVASRIGGLPEIIRDGDTGFLVEPGDVDALRDRLAAVLGDPALARGLGGEARAHVREHFTWDACARRCLNAYRELFK
jgi:glycosyltransferase involved in cell wall biosynthesis